MRNKILILSHNFHTFLLNEIDYAAQIYEKVVVVTSYEEQLVKKFSSYPNVELCLFSEKELKMAAMSSSFRVLSLETWKEINRARKEGVVSSLYLKSLSLYYGICKILKKAVSHYHIGDCPKEWILFSAWYASTAYAVASWKEKYKDLATVSLAHSFEIDKRKTKFVDVLFRYNYHNYLDLTSFISQNVWNEFYNEHAKKLGIQKEKVEVRYLGTRKLLETKKQGIENPHCISIVSCSYAVPVKRLELLLQACEEKCDYKVIWYHLGAGPCLEKLKQKASQVENDKLEIHLLGKMDSLEVHKFLSENDLDVFVNVSASEGIPVTIMEAMAYGIPVVATDVGGNSEIVDESCGKLISKDPSPAEIMSAIIGIKEKRMQSHKLSEQAKEKYDSFFDSDKIRPKFYKRLQSL